MSEATDEDLRDVFRLLYADADYASDDDEPEEHPPLDAIAPELEVEQVEADVEVEPEYSRRFTRKRLRDAVDSLVLHKPKRLRVYNPTTASSFTIIPSTHPTPLLPSSSAYAPFSPLALLARLRTFLQSTFSPASHTSLEPLELAMRGWTNTAREVVSCARCGASWDLSGVTEISDNRVRGEVARRLGERVKEGHKAGCAWRVRCTPPEVYKQIRHTLHPVITSSLAPLADQLQRCCLSDKQIAWSSPVPDKQLQRLSIHFSQYLEPPDPQELNDSRTQPGSVSPLAVALALFAWCPYGMSAGTEPMRKTDILQCRICQRRVGLWRFSRAEGTSGNVLDLEGEHLAWCPIRARGEGGKAWWEIAEIMRFEKAPRVEKGWIRVSEGVTGKPWRRAR